MSLPAETLERKMGAEQTLTRTLTFAHSPDPDDAYMFYGFAEGAVKIPGYEITHP